MVHHVKDIPAAQRQAIEAVLGRALRDDESLIIRPSHVLQDSPTGVTRARSARQYQDHLDQLAGRVGDVPESEIDAAIDEAVERVRHKPE
jgi:hypothetical protein